MARVRRGRDRDGGHGGEGEQSGHRCLGCIGGCRSFRASGRCRSRWLTATAPPTTIIVSASTAAPPIAASPQLNPPTVATRTTRMPVGVAGALCSAVTGEHGAGSTRGSADAVAAEVLRSASATASLVQGWRWTMVRMPAQVGVAGSRAASAQSRDRHPEHGWRRLEDGGGSRVDLGSLCLRR